MNWFNDNKWVVTKYITLVCIIILTIIFVLNNNMNQMVEYRGLRGVFKETSNGVAVILMFVSIVFILFGEKLFRMSKEWWR